MLGKGDRHVTDITGSEEPAGTDRAALDGPSITPVPIAPGAGGIAVPAAVIVDSASDRAPTGHDHDPDHPAGGHSHEHEAGDDSHSHGHADDGRKPGVIDGLVDSVRGLFNRSDKPR